MGLLSFFNGLFSRSDSVSSFPDTRQQARERMLSAAQATSRWVNPAGIFRGEKYGSIDYRNITGYNYTHLRRNSRGVYHESLIARGVVNRYVNNVINTGLTWESSPLWQLIPAWNGVTDEEKYEWTQYVESLWKLYAESKEADIEGRQTFQQIQRNAFRLGMIDGEMIGIIRYLNSPSRISPIAIQKIKPEQIQQPGYEELRSIEKRGGTVDYGIEKNSTGAIVALHVRGDSGKTTRVPTYGPKSGRRFVIHTGNFEAVGQSRGLPELSSIIYELKKLTDYDIAELEATVSQAAFMAMFEADKDASAGLAPKLRPNVSNKTATDNEPQVGLEKTEIDKFSLVIEKMPPGYVFKGFQPTRPNQNYDAFVRAFETRMAGALGMPLSILQQKFEGSYSSARAEILFFWNEVQTRRDDFVAGFLSPFYESVFTEWVRAGEVIAQGYDRPIIKKAWLHGSWNGISRPTVDPLKEVKAVSERTKLGHTTGEREAKAYNGSDYRENVRRLMTENELLSEANSFGNPDIDTSNNDREENQDD